MHICIHIYIYIHTRTLDLGFKEHECILMFERIAEELQTTALYKKHNYIKELNIKNEIENNNFKNRKPPSVKDLNKNLFSPPKSLLNPKIKKVRKSISEVNNDLLMMTAFGIHI
jgi:4-diphosphocytidyl-2C-methyl-D-erythritol kinase